MDAGFKALADESRRELWDRLFERRGQTLVQLCGGHSMTRQAVTKHLRILGEAGLVVTHWKGREKRNYLNPVPIGEISPRLLAKFERARVDALLELKTSIEEQETRVIQSLYTS
jgi:DNA-binding transcriptional ArsR family regulator